MMIVPRRRRSPARSPALPRTTTTPPRIPAVSPGGPLPGETAGMRGGVVVVRGKAGDRAGDRLRRGTIIIEGHAGAHAGSRMIPGTLILCRDSGPIARYR